MKNFYIFCLLCLCVACASGAGIFPTIDLDTAEADVTMPNPISVVSDATNNQIIVANSNIDILFDTGSLAVLTFDATDVNAPTLTAAQIISTPNFASRMYFDGNASLYLPFREASTTDADKDSLIKYTEPLLLIQLSPCLRSSRFLPFKISETLPVFRYLVHRIEPAFHIIYPRDFIQFFFIYLTPPP